MRLKEQKLWDSMRAAQPKGRGLWMQRIENSVGEGIPDVLVMGRQGAVCWVELKAPVRPKRETTAFLGVKQGVRISQENWHVKAHSLEQKSYVLIRDDHNKLYLVDNSHVASLNSAVRSVVEHWSLASDWKSVFNTIYPRNYWERN